MTLQPTPVPDLFVLARTTLRPTFEHRHAEGVRVPQTVHPQVTGAHQYGLTFTQITDEGTAKRLAALYVRWERALIALSTTPPFASHYLNPGTENRWHCDGEGNVAGCSYMALAILGPRGTPGTLFDATAQVRASGMQHETPTRIFPGRNGTLYLTPATLLHASPVRENGALLLRWAVTPKDGVLPSPAAARSR